MTSPGPATADAAPQPDKLNDVERMLVIQRKAVLLYGDGEGAREDAMRAVWHAASRHATSVQVLDAKPEHEEIWAGAVLQMHSHRSLGLMGWSFYTQLSLAYADKYPDERPTSYTGSTHSVLLVNLLGMTKNPTSHAWSYFAPQWRAANFLYAIAPLAALNELRPLIELVHPLDQCVVSAPGYESLRLG